MTYAGHLPDGSSVQQHSAGQLYPCVIFARQTPGRLAWGIISPEHPAGTLIGTEQEARERAVRLNAARRTFQPQEPQ